MILRGLVVLCTFRPRDVAVFVRFDEVTESMILRGLVLFVPPPYFVLLQHSPVWTFRGRV